MASKGIILAGGHGTRLLPTTKVVNKHILPIYDKPMIFYPLATLMLAGIKDILVISTQEAVPQLSTLLGDGADLGLTITYAEQKEANGIAEALLIGEEFIQNSRVCLILGDNVFYGNDLSILLENAANKTGNLIFSYYVKEPSAFGVCEFNASGKPINLIEKPVQFVSNWVVPGMYFFEAEAVGVAKSLKASSRGEIEITDLNKRLLQTDRLEVVQMGRGIFWMDCGTPEDLLEASEFVKVVEKRV